MCRFGEESLHSCEVMLKDVEDSKRANNGVHSELAKLTPPPRQVRDRESVRLHSAVPAALRKTPYLHTFLGFSASLPE